MVYCYIIKGTEDFHYCGITNNITKRYAEHNKKKSKSTKKHTPYIILHLEQFEDRISARIREKQIKNYGVRRWYMRKVKFR